MAFANPCNCILIVATVRRQPISANARFDGLIPLDWRAVAMASAPRLWESAQIFESNPTGRSDRDEILTMDPNDIIDFLHATARSVGAEVTSPWFYL
jgi:hypothetical protein